MVILGDFTTSLHRALSEIDNDYLKYKGIIIAGTHTPNNIDTMINSVSNARKYGIPLLGICFGHQIVAIEYAKNVLGIKNATSEEFGEGEFVVKKLPTLNIGHINDGTYWNNYEVDSKILEKIKLPDNILTTQYHPEYESFIGNKNTILVYFIKKCKEYSVK